MFKYLTIIVALSVSIMTSCAQIDQKDYEGEWIGFLPNKNSFNFQVTLHKGEGTAYHLKIANDTTLFDESVTSSSTNGVEFTIDNQLFFDLQYTQNEQVLTGFIQTGKLMYHVNLQHQGNDTFAGAWNPFMVDNGLQSDDIMLYIEPMNEKTLAAYPFFGDQRFRGTWTADFKQKGDILLFTDGMTGFNFRAKLSKKNIELEIFLADMFITKTNLTHTNDGWEYHSDYVHQPQNTNTPAQLKDGWETTNIDALGINKSELTRLITDVEAQKLVNTHSILIAKENKLVFETYFDGFNAHIPHDLRSASKSISSAIIGIAIDENIIKSVDEKLYDFLPETYQYTKDPQKANITLKDLLTMSSGLDVNNQASENNYQDPRFSNNWLKTVLEAPMVKEPGTYADYGSANPFLLGVCLNEHLDIPLETYMDEKLFAPLGITNYINQTDDSKITPYFGGGMLLTSRDLLKFGQLYQNKGKWKGQQIISEKWVEASFGKYLRLQDYNDKNLYGYLWWHDTYEVNGKAYEAIEARGAGGQFIFILPALESVVVITSGNFRNRKGNQPREILKDYIIPALVN
ncbi:serine hydrolase domain-containing protein [Dokdonia pacifica]|uniref:CubicO group peptidase, beta-lactamase class C family n=1 Tax=Dokdonia pacifica TaxID=1627892 RepID=A0A238ZNK7_9FLAO|nr:serine hydrolase [Dokdonia pacifica]SNR84548.1 CubicO group peptidase, beta-lactamase class C family [Dokdonia pacifica]